MASAIPPNDMTDRERIEEVTELLATGFLRSRLQIEENQSNSAQIGPEGLHFSSEQSVHVATPVRRWRSE